MMEGATADGGGLLTLCVTFCELWLVELFVFTFWLFVVTSEVDELILLLLLVFVETLVELFVFKLVFSDVELLVISEVLLTFCV